MVQTKRRGHSVKAKEGTCRDDGYRQKKGKGKEKRGNQSGWSECDALHVDFFAEEDAG